MSPRLTLARPALVGLLGILNAACGTSPPTRFFTLNPSGPSDPPANVEHIDGAMLRVQPLVIPAELDRLELVTHAGPNLVRIAGEERWASPLDEQIRRVVSEDLALRLPAHTVADPYEPATLEPRRLLSLEIGAFTVNPSCAVTLDADWTLQQSGSTAPAISGTEHLALPGSGSCPGLMAQAMSAALGTLADRLVVALQSRASSSPQTPTTSTSSPTAPRKVKPSGLALPGTGSAPSPTG